jgi:hypothetical protein
MNFSEKVFTFHKICAILRVQEGEYPERSQKAKIEILGRWNSSFCIPHERKLSVESG